VIFSEPTVSRLALLVALVVGAFASAEAFACHPDLHGPAAADAVFHGALGTPAAEPVPGSPRRRRQGDAETL